MLKAGPLTYEQPIGGAGYSHIIGRVGEGVGVAVPRGVGDGFGFAVGSVVAVPRGVGDGFGFTVGSGVAVPKGVGDGFGSGQDLNISLNFFANCSERAQYTALDFASILFLVFNLVCAESLGASAIFFSKLVTRS